MVRSLNPTKSHSDTKCVLTNREIEYLALVGLGYKNIEIALILIVSPSTVKKTLENIYDKLKAKDRANAIAIGFMHEILKPEILTAMSKTEKVANFEKSIKKEN